MYVRGEGDCPLRGAALLRHYIPRNDGIKMFCDDRVGCYDGRI